MSGRTPAVGIRYPCSGAGAPEHFTGEISMFNVISMDLIELSAGFTSTATQLLDCFESLTKTFRAQDPTVSHNPQWSTSFSSLLSTLLPLTETWHEALLLLLSISTTIWRMSAWSKTDLLLTTIAKSTLSGGLQSTAQLVASCLHSTFPSIAGQEWWNDLETIDVYRNYRTVEKAVQASLTQFEQGTPNPRLPPARRLPLQQTQALPRRLSIPFSSLPPSFSRPIPSSNGSPPRTFSIPPTRDRSTSISNGRSSETSVSVWCSCPTSAVSIFVRTAGALAFESAFSS
ncbi:hypothetical protein RQP46_006590 [Phenoliferia psychrophenolica]